MPIAPATMSIPDPEPKENIHPDIAQMAVPIPEDTLLKCSEPGCDNERTYPNLSALRYATPIPTVGEALLLIGTKQTSRKAQPTLCM
jgi:hypothetical protein